MTSLTGSSGEDFASILRALGYRMEKRPKPAEPPAQRSRNAKRDGRECVRANGNGRTIRRVRATAEKVTGAADKADAAETDAADAADAGIVDVHQVETSSESGGAQPDAAEPATDAVALAADPDHGAVIAPEPELAAPIAAEPGAAAEIQAAAPDALSDTCAEPVRPTRTRLRPQTPPSPSWSKSGGRADGATSGAANVGRRAGIIAMAGTGPELAKPRKGLSPLWRKVTARRQLKRVMPGTALARPQPHRRRHPRPGPIAASGAGAAAAPANFDATTASAARNVRTSVAPTIAIVRSAASARTGPIAHGETAASGDGRSAATGVGASTFPAASATKSPIPIRPSPSLRH